MTRRSLSLAPLVLVLFAASAQATDVYGFLNTPTIKDSAGNVLQAGRIQKINLATGGAPTVVVDGLAYPSGLGLDPAGNLYFGNVTFSPIRIALMERAAADGTVTNLGTVLDTAAGGVAIGAWGFDVRILICDPVSVIQDHVHVGVDDSGLRMLASFTPPPVANNSHPTLAAYASACDFTSFNWATVDHS